MASILPGPMASDIRGSTGGVVFSRNRGGAYTRNRTVPINPQSPAQVAQREALTAASRAWQDLSPAAKDAWNAAAEQVPPADAINRVGQAITLNGQQYFVRCNTVLGTLNSPSFPVEEPPFDGVIGRIQEVTNASIEFDTTPSDQLFINLTIEYAIQVGTFEALQIYATTPRGPGSFSNRASECRYLVFTGTQTGVVDATVVGDAYVERFGVPPIGSRVGLAVRIVDVARGVQGKLSVLNFVPVEASSGP